MKEKIRKRERLNFEVLLNLWGRDNYGSLTYLDQILDKHTSSTPTAN
jgi:hypothetical protein